jgi:nucleoside-diphosphate-sugar epimerase
MYGSKDDAKKFLAWLINEMITGTEEINLTSGEQKRDFIFISDVVEAYNLVLKKRKNLPLWNQFDVGTNVFTRVKEFVLTIAKELEKPNETKIIPRLNFGAIPYRKADKMTPELDISKLIELGWKHETDINIGVKKILKEYK